MIQRFPDNSPKNFPEKTAINQGFMIIVFVVVVTAAVLLVIFGVPKVYSALTSDPVTEDRDRLLSALTFARSEAIKRGDRVVLCPYAAVDVNSCTSIDQIAGWVVYHLEQSNNLVVNRVLLREPLSEVYELGNHNIYAELIKNDNVIASPNDHRSLAAHDATIAFQPTGRPTQWGRLRFCNPAGKGDSLTVALTATGEISAGESSASCSSALLPTEEK